jgi:hypothetical protein
MLQTLVEFLQQHVEFSHDRRLLVSREDLQSHLRLHIAAVLSASPATSKMTVEVAFRKLSRYAKTLGQDLVLNELETFVDRSVCQYIAEELMQVCEQLLLGRI